MVAVLEASDDDDGEEISATKVEDGHDFIFDRFRRF